MVLSGDSTFSLTGAQIVEQAFKKLGVQPAEQPLQAFELSDGLLSLNLMLKSWQAQGNHLWTRREGVLFLSPGTPTYTVGQTGSESCLFDDFIATTLTAEATAATTTLTVDSTVGMVALDRIGVQSSTTARQWTTIVSVDSAATLTITDPITVTSALGNSVFTYTAKMTRPSRVSDMRRVTYNIDSEISLTKVSRQEYYDQPTKLGLGVVNMFYYDPSLTNGVVSLWQTGNTVNDYLRVSYSKYIDDIDSSNNDLEIPPEWQECIIYNLAARLSDDYDVPEPKLSRVTQLALLMLRECLGYDEEMTSLTIVGDYNSSW